MWEGQQIIKWEAVNTRLNKSFSGDLRSFWIISPAKLPHWKTKTKVPQKNIMGPLKSPAGKEVQEWCVLGLHKEATFDV